MGNGLFLPRLYHSAWGLPLLAFYVDLCVTCISSEVFQKENPLRHCLRKKVFVFRHS